MLGLAKLNKEKEFFLDLHHEVHLKYSEQDLEHEMKKMKEVDKLSLSRLLEEREFDDLD